MTLCKDSFMFMMGVTTWLWQCHDSLLQLKSYQICIFPIVFHVLPKTDTSALLFTFNWKFFIFIWRAQSSCKVIVCVPNVANSVINHNCLANVSTVTLLQREHEWLSQRRSLYFSLRPVCGNDYGFLNAPLRLSRLNFGAIILLGEAIMTHSLSLFS